jgi:hypothetical protein
MTTNPYAAARTQVVDALATLGVPVLQAPVSSLSGPAVTVTATTKDPRGHVEVEVTVSAPAAANASALAIVDQLAWDVELAIGAAGNIGWGDCQRPTLNDTTQRIARVITLTTRP